MDIEFTGETLTYRLNENVYTATSSPYVVTPTDINFTSALTSCNNTFGGSYGSNLTTLNDFFDTSKVTDMTSMFRNCNNLKKLNLMRWNTDSLKNVQQCLRVAQVLLQ